MIDRRGVDAEDGHLAVVHQEMGGVAAVGGEVQIAGVARRVVAEVGQAIGPPATPAGTQEHDGALGHPIVDALPLGDVALGELVVGVGLGLLADVDDHRRTDQSVERDLVRCPAPGREVDRRVEVSPAVLRSREAVGRVEEAGFEAAVSELLELEAAG